ncbi:hypothetical protein JW698_01875 [Candidatus Wolfebacteria bacterium]|nr:hypothetical protein [Candidatus Wolfebacteria bacterium]
MEISLIKKENTHATFLVDEFIEVSVKRLPKGKIIIASVFGGRLSRPLKTATLKKAAAIL